MKPFNLEHAKAGAPVMTDKGMPARIVAFDLASSTEASLVVLIANDDETESVRTAFPDGTIQYNQHLVMAPLAELDGRPVHVGDKLERNISGEAYEVSPSDSKDSPSWAALRWPRTYPTTRMPCAAMLEAFSPGSAKWPRAPVAPGEQYPEERLAAAVIKHGIDNGYLYDAQRVNRVLRALATVPNAHINDADLLTYLEGMTK